MGWHSFWGHFCTITRHRHTVMRHCRRAGIFWQGLRHDLSKYSPTEFWQGVRYYQDGKRSPNEAEREALGYSLAWMHHKGRNRHHFEYWSDYNPRTKQVEPVEMPVRFLAEMFCDRVAASKIYMKDAYDQTCPLAYFQKSTSRKRGLLHANTERELMRLLTLLAEQGEDAAFAELRRMVAEDRKKRKGVIVMFCQNCGKKIEGGDLFCPFCGAKQQQVNPSENAGASFTAGSQKLTRKGLGIAVICVLIVIVLALVLIGSLCTGGPKQVVKEYYQAIEKCDAKKLLDTVPKDYLEEIMDEKDMTKRELLKEVQAYLDKYYSGYDDIKDSITDQEKLDRDDFSDYFDFDLEDDADFEIKKAVQFDLKVRYQSDEGKQTEKEEFIVFRYENSWYSMDAVFLVAMSTYL